MNTEDFLKSYPSQAPIFKRTRDPSRKTLRTLIEKFERTCEHVSPTGMTAEWLMKWCRATGRSYTLDYRMWRGQEYYILKLDPMPQHIGPWSEVDHPVDGIENS